MPCILALDQGTTSSRAILFDQTGRTLASAQAEFPQLFPRSGWVEHDPLQIWSTQLTVARQAIAEARIPPADITAIGITNQRETTLVWDRRTGNPIHNAIVWQDRRTADLCANLKRQGHEPLIQQKTGLLIDPYFSATKLAWILDHVPNARVRAKNGELAFGTVDSWLLFNLTDKKIHATDPTNAARTLLFNIHTADWDTQLLNLFNIPREMLPKVHPSSFPFAETTLFGPAIPIAGIAGDQQAALFGQSCFAPGQSKCTYGTGAFILMNTGPTPAVSKHKLLTTVAASATPPTVYALEGSIFVAGAVVQWLRDGLKIIKSTDEIEPLAASVPDNGGVFIVPAFAGLGAPHWDPYARGAIAGITRGATSAHFARAALESIAYQVADILDIMRSDSHLPIPALRVDGGAARNNLLLQFQSDLLRIPVLRPKQTETTALGAAYLAGLAVKFWTTLPAPQIDRTFEPQTPESEARRHRARWQEALNRSRNWEKNES